MQAWGWILAFIALVAATAAFGVGFRRSKRTSIPMADARPLRRPARRTSALWGAGALAATALVAAGMGVLPVAHQRSPNAARPLPSTLVVLDVSGSISPPAFGEIASTLDAVARAGGGRRAGLVVFSDVAYEALPPEAPPEQLRSFERYFRHKRGASATANRQSSFPTRPWTESFSGGTVISSGLRLARRAIHRDGVPRAVVLLVSDLADAPSDWNALQQELAAYSRDPTLTLRVVPLPPSRPNDWARRMIGPARVVTGDSGREILTEPRRTRDYRLLLFAALVVALGLVLTVNELVGTKLAWQPAAGLTSSENERSWTSSS